MTDAGATPWDLAYSCISESSEETPGTLSPRKDWQSRPALWGALQNRREVQGGCLLSPGTTGGARQEEQTPQPPVPPEVTSQRGLPGSC